MPDSFQTMAACADNQWCFLASLGAVLQGGKLVAHHLQAVEQVVEVLDLGYGTQAAHGHTDSMSNDGCFTDSCIRDAQFTEFFLHSFHRLVYSANFSGVFTKR